MTVKILMLLYVFVAIPAQAQESIENDVASVAKAKLLGCHESYVKRYATAVPAATATDLATGAKWHCSVELDSYLAEYRKVREGNPLTAISANEEVTAEAERIEKLTFARAVDTFIQARAMF